MKLCSNCQKLASVLKNSLTRLERTHLLASAVSMAGIIHHGSGRATEQDRVVSSSVITKLIWSFEPEARPLMLKYFRESVGVDINVSDCAHTTLSVVS
jgi:hypothetical protein